MDISKLVADRISRGNAVLQRLSSVNIDGISKLRSKIKQEINFLEKHVKNDKLREEHLTCSNLTHLEAVASQLIKRENDCISIMNSKTLSKSGDTSVRKICIDLVLFGGSVWMKVIARNRKALTLVSKGDCSFGQKSIIDQAQEFIDCSNQHIHYFNPPTVIFYFANGIEESLSQDLRNIGVKVEIPRESSCYEETLSNSCIENSEQMSIRDIKIAQNIKLIKDTNNTKLNLGVTTMLAYVSALTNGGCHRNFESEILRMHAEWERARPVKPILDKLFDGRELYCCKSAADNFKKILYVLGGKGERERGEQLLNRITIVEDHPTTKLKPSGKIKERSLAIFGTGQYLKAITVTANHAFIRSAMNKGFYFEVFLHESRALTEGKELPT